MNTLYDLLGALPRDDAESLRTAFRKAVKGTHPDINPGDPDAALKFREIVRANEILLDHEQRAAYDHLLDLARREHKAASRPSLAAAIYKLASSTAAIVGISAVTFGGYLLFIHISAASVVPPDEVETTGNLSQVAVITSVEPENANEQEANEKEVREQDATAPGVEPGDRTVLLQKAFADLGRAMRNDAKSQNASASMKANSPRHGPRVHAASRAHPAPAPPRRTAQPAAPRQTSPSHERTLPLLRVAEERRLPLVRVVDERRFPLASAGNAALLAAPP